MNPMFIVALKELTDGLRNRWVLAITCVFALLAIGLSYFGAAASGQTGLSPLPTTIASLTSLAVFIIPLIALLLSYDAFVSEAESGTLLLLLSYPISKGQILVGKFIGQGGLLTLATILGFGAAALVLILAGQYNTSELLVLFSRFIFVSILLGWSFIAFAFVISVSCAEKSKAAGLALLLWFVAVLLFDLVLLGLLVADVTWLTEQQLGLLLLFNPTDIFRLVNLMGLEQSAVGGVLNLAEGTNYSINQLVLVMVIWVLIPLFLAHRRFRRF